MKVSLSLPIDIDDKAEFQNPAAAREMARAAEAAGVDACWITDHPAPSAKWRMAGGHDALDPFAGLAFVAGATEKLRLHTQIVVLPYRNPFLTAKAAATVDVLSGGRMIMGVGVGYMRGEYAALGVEFERRGALTDEALVVIKQAWSGEPVIHEGIAFNAIGNLARPVPVQQPGPPIWCGGNSNAALRRAVQHCDGWSPFFSSAEVAQTTRTDAIVTMADFDEKLATLREHLDRAERTRPFDIVIQPPIGITRCSADEARAIIDHAGELGARGVNWLVLSVPHATRAAYLDNVAWLGQEVLPHLRALGPQAWSGGAC